jgi:hypothetical protein
LFKPIETRGIDLAIQSAGDPAIHRKKSEKTSNCGDVMLKSRSTQVLAGFSNVRFDITRLNGS